MSALGNPYDIRRVLDITVCLLHYCARICNLAALEKEISDAVSVKLSNISNVSFSDIDTINSGDCVLISFADKKYPTKIFGNGNFIYISRVFYVLTQV